MIKVFCLSSVLILSMACSHAQDKIVFPEKPPSQKKPDQTRILGTKLFLNIPKGYTYVKAFSVLKKNEDVKINVIYYPTIGFDVIRKSIFEEPVYSKDIHDMITKDYKLDSLKATYVAATEHGKWGLFYLIGGEKGTHIITGSCDETDTASRREIQECILGCYLDQGYKVDHSEPYTVCIAIANTDLKFLAVKSYGTAFSPGGKGEFSELPRQTQVLISAGHELRSMRDTISLRYLAEEQFSKYSYNGYTVKDVKKEYSNWEGSDFPLFELTYSAQCDGRELKGYIAVVGNQTGHLLFSCTAFEDGEIRVEAFKRLVRSAKLD